MKDTIIKIGLISLCMLSLSACRQEPMIQLSEENKAKIEAKKNQEQTESQDRQSTTESNSEKKTAPQEKLSIDKSHWQTLEEASSFSILDFLPMQANEIRTFSNGSASKSLYLMSTDDQKQVQHILVIQDNQLRNESYSWAQQALTKSSKQNDSRLFVLDSTESENTLLMKEPLTLTDQSNGITEIYREAKIGESTYQNVLQVSVGDQTYYFAQAVGLIAVENNKESWIIQARNQNVKLISSIPVVVPQADGSSLLRLTSGSLDWQTNQDLASAFTNLFQSQNFIGADIVVNQIELADNTVTIDFSPGVVATMNAHPQGEQAVIAAIVANIHQWLGVDQVRLTVNQYGLAPDTFTYPEQGVYHYDAKWLEEAQTNPFQTQ